MKLFLVLSVLLGIASADLLIDTDTFFMWEDRAENKGTLHNWQEAKTYCEELELEGFDDWWLPSESELITIVDRSRPAGRRIKKGFIYYKRDGVYWSASTYAWNAPHAWAVDFGSGATYTLPKEGYHFVRCVRCSDFKKCIELFYEK
jgi:hypothetical protein